MSNGCNFPSVWCADAGKAKVLRHSYMRLIDDELHCTQFHWNAIWFGKTLFLNSGGVAQLRRMHVREYIWKAFRCYCFPVQVPRIRIVIAEGKMEATQIIRHLLSKIAITYCGEYENGIFATKFPVQCACLWFPAWNFRTKHSKCSY